MCRCGVAAGNAHEVQLFSEQIIINHENLHSVLIQKAEGKGPSQKLYFYQAVHLQIRMASFVFWGCKVFKTKISFLLTVVLIFCAPSSSYAQSAAFKKLSCPEKWWVFLHPFIAKKAYRITTEARAVSKEMENDSLLDHDADGGQVDAFRHSYWMARLTQEMCKHKALSLGKAHEKGNYKDFTKHRQGEEVFSDSAASAMDLFNNDIGASTGEENKSLPEAELIKLIRRKILSGEMRIILKDKEGHSLTCDGKILGLEKFQGIWNIPRCVVSSAEIKK